MIKKQCWTAIGASRSGRNLHLVRGYGFFRKGSNCPQRNISRKFSATLLKRNVQLHILLMQLFLWKQLWLLTPFIHSAKSIECLVTCQELFVKLEGKNKKWKGMAWPLMHQHFKTYSFIKSLPLLSFLVTILSLWLQSQDPYCYHFLIYPFAIFSFDQYFKHIENYI